MFSDYTPSENEYNPHSDVTLSEQSRDEVGAGDGYKQQPQTEIMGGKYKQQASQQDFDDNMTNQWEQQQDKQQQQELKPQIETTSVQSKLSCA